MNKEQLEINVNLHALQPGFLNLELHYIIASDENNFRFANWSEQPLAHEYKFYCFLVEEPLFIPAGNITRAESYVLREEPFYDIIATPENFMNAIEKLRENGFAKMIRHFSDNDVASIQQALTSTCGHVEQHVVTSDQGQHLLLITDTFEISISDTMVYLRNKAPFSQSHYASVTPENAKD